MKRGLFSILPLLVLLSCQQPIEVLQQGDITFVPMETKRLPDMNVPRTGHALVWTNGHILAIGGHTTGFVPTPTAEYYKGGQWHLIPTLYLHDTPFALVLKNGDVMVGGGYETDFGVGRTFGVERYRPDSHGFSPESIMEINRAHASALELEDGEILISGNWYATDFTEIYHNSADTIKMDTSSDNRSYPLLLPVTHDNVWIVGGTYNSYGTPTQHIVDQLIGEPFEVELLTEWHPQTPLDHNVQVDAYRIAEHTFLICGHNKEGQCAPLLVDSCGFSLLPMEQPLPKEGPWGAIRYFGSFWTCQETATVWLMGKDEQARVYLAEIDYQPVFQGGKATLSMHYTQPLEQLPSNPWDLMLPDGSFVVVGGMNGSNYDASATAMAFYPQSKPPKLSVVIVIIVCVLLMIGLWLVFVIRKRKQGKEESVSIPEEEVPSSGKSELAEKLKVLMEEQQLFKNKDLRIADVAAALGTNITYLSTYLNGELKTTFPTFITGYRIQYAQELMRENPSMRLAQVAETSGFANEKTFLRAFKACCGLTPSEWKQKNLP